MRFGHLSDDIHRRILEMSWSFSATRSQNELACAASESIDRILGADYLAHNAVNLAGARPRVSILPRAALSVVSEEALAGAIVYHPAVERLGALGSHAVPMRTGDIVKWSEFAKTKAYSDLCEPHGLKHQLLIPLSSDSVGRTATLYTINRCDLEFTDDDLSLAYALQAVLATHHFLWERKSTPPEDRVTEAKRRLGLTAREAEVLVLVSSGLTVNAVAHLLRLSPRTVRKHIENAYSTLDVHDRLQAVAVCRRFGLIE